MKNKLKLTASAYDKEIILIVHDDFTIDEFMDAVEVLAIGLTFPKETVDKGFIEKARELEE